MNIINAPAGQRRKISSTHMLCAIINTRGKNANMQPVMNKKKGRKMLSNKNWIYRRVFIGQI
jgi:hypothetical protein